MPNIEVIFRGLNTDLPAEQLRSGTASVATNVTLRNGVLQKRAGFDEWEDDVNGAGGAILNIVQAKFANGKTYIVCKMDDGFLWQRDVENAASFSKITDLWSGHTADEKGSFFQYADRLLYFDTNGGTKWHPTAGTWKAGIALPSKPTATATTATNGAKDGRYHYHTTFRNNVTGEEGLFSNPSDSVTCEADANNAINIASVTLPTSYEADQTIGYSTTGNTEYYGKGDGIEVRSFIAYRDHQRNSSGSWKATAADDVLRLRARMSTRWGLPPAANLVAYDGDRAVYAGAQAGLINFSLPKYPCSLPNRVEWSSGDDQMILDPDPWESWLGTGTAGEPTEVVAGGGVFGVFTDHETFILVDNEDRSMRLRKVRSGRGCVTHRAAVGTIGGIHAIGYRSWSVLSRNGFHDLSRDRFVTTLETIPVAQQTKTRMAEFAFHDQIWASVVGAGKTVAQNILIWDTTAGGTDENGRALGGLSIFEIAGMTSDESITAMAELSFGTAEPTMLIGTDDGRILQYPSLVGDDDSSGVRKHYAASWRGYIGANYPIPVTTQRLKKAVVHAGENVQDWVTFNIRARLTSDQTITPGEVKIPVSDRKFTIDPSAFENNFAGAFFEMGFESDSTCPVQWTITNFMADLKVDAR